jgi:hypothetical protein
MQGIRFGCPAFLFHGEAAMMREVFATWERQHGFDSDRFLRDEKSRIGEVQIKQEDKLLRSRTQWKECGRMVMHGSQAVKTVVTRSGHNLHLFSKAQTKSL